DFGRLPVAVRAQQPEGVAPSRDSAIDFRRLAGFYATDYRGDARQPTGRLSLVLWLSDSPEAASRLRDAADSFVVPGLPCPGAVRRDRCVVPAEGAGHDFSSRLDRHLSDLRIPCLLCRICALLASDRGTGRNSRVAPSTQVARCGLRRAARARTRAR